MHKSMKIVGRVLATIGIACVVKHIMHRNEDYSLCGCHKIKVEDEKPTGTTVSNNIKVEDEKRHGLRYGSNPTHY
jgi:hypothetical protein